MYERFFRVPAEGWLAHYGYRQEAVDYHLGTCRDFMRRHMEAAKRAAAGGREGIKEIAPFLLNRVADARTLRCAWDYLRREGGQAPGHNGHRYEDFGDSEVWSLLRAIGAAIRAQDYRRGPDTKRSIPKGPKGSGRFRTLTLSNIEDRVVERAIVLVIQPLLDPRFDVRSFGYRPDLDRCHALALAEHLALGEGRMIWVTEDLKDAFDHVPLRRLLDVVRVHIPAPDLVALIERVIINDTGKGLRQGGPLSCLLLNVYLDHLLDRPWRRQHPDTPHVRVADDMLLLCQAEEDALAGRADLERLLTPAGMPIKQATDTVYRLAQGDIAQWLGFEIGAGTDCLEVRVGEGSWEQFQEHLTMAHTKPDAPLRAIAIIEGWVSQLGATYPFSDRKNTCQRIASIAHQQCFDEIPSEDRLLELWQRAYARWSKLRKAASRKTLDTVSGQKATRQASLSSRKETS